MRWLLQLLALFRRDFAALPRKPWFYRHRLGLAAFGSLILLAGLFTINERTAAPGLMLFRHLAIGSVVLAVIMALTLAATILDDERTNQTLELLLIAHYTPLQVVLARHGLVCTLTTLTLLVFTPLFGLIATLGGTTWATVAALAAIAVANTYLGAAIGLWATAMARTHRRSLIYTIVAAAVVYVFLPLGVAAILALYQVPFARSLIGASAIFAVLAAVTLHASAAIAIHVGAALVLGTVLLFAAAATMAAALRTADQETTIDRLYRELCHTLPLRYLATRPEIEGNPIVWLDLHLLYGGRRTGWLKVSFFSLLLTAIILTCCSFLDLPTAEAWRKVWLFLSIFYAVAWTGGTLSACSHAFDREKKHRAADMLLTSDLTNEELLYGKLVGIVTAYSPYLLCLTGCLCTAFIVLEDGHDHFSLLLLMLELATVWFACASASLYVSLRLRSARNATLVFVSYVLIWALIAMPFPGAGPEATFLFALITGIWHIYLSTLCWRIMLRHCRELLLNEPIRPVDPHPVSD
jgi:ABC-type transport system involved in multi-copper enzyme maturation permease subunit